ncbi:MAG: hypothetical protein HHJ17_15520 [Rhodoferax sp.]|uniref:hypothetical protein n=1 Tax=Rhodoferax sp. TaxID=50421 RepID=UPI00184EE5A1|nr:hypothetical protein [Rhodoferax sp.]NMM14929.1 hypothetical protein [Rhodoferax sp.]
MKPIPKKVCKVTMFRVTMAARPVSVPSIQALMAKLRTGLPSLGQNSPESGQPRHFSLDDDEEGVA